MLIIILLVKILLHFFRINKILHFLTKVLRFLSEVINFAFFRYPLSVINITLRGEGQTFLCFSLYKILKIDIENAVRAWYTIPVNEIFGRNFYAW